jgi:cytochrome c peroxidase
MNRVRAAVVLLPVLAAGAAAALALGDDDLSPADLKAAQAAEQKALDLGRKVFTDLSLGTADRSCSTCHDNPQKPQLSLKGVTTRFPRWDRDAGKVITLQQKFVQMQERSLKARKTLPLGDERWIALEMHLRGLK